MPARTAINNQRPSRLIVQEADKLRGGYYTPPELATWLCQWAIRSKDDQILEPSCGNGIFLSAAIRRLKELGLHPLSSAARNRPCA